MIGVLIALALVLLAATVVLLALMTVGSLAHRRSARRRMAAERRLRPLAIALVEGEQAEAPALTASDQRVFAEVLSRYSRKLTGDASTRIATYFRDHGGLEEALAGLRARRSWRRASAAYALGDMQCGEAVPALVAALEDSGEEVRAAAARSLGRLGDGSVALPLLEGLVARQVPRGVAGQALVRLGSSVVPELHRIAGHEEPEVRAAAVSLVGILGDPRDADVAAQALRDASAPVRTAAAQALERIGGSQQEDALRAALEDRSHHVRSAAATSLGAIGARVALPRLIAMSRGDRFRPARAAAQAIARIDTAALEAAAAEPGAGPHLHEAADLRSL